GRTTTVRAHTDDRANLDRLWRHAADVRVAIGSGVGSAAAMCARRSVTSVTATPPAMTSTVVHCEIAVNAMNTEIAPHVLVIDDDPAMRQLIAEYLGENELRVTAVATGAEMSHALSEHAIDAIVLDLRLAGEDGMQLASK